MCRSGPRPLPGIQLGAGGVDVGARCICGRACAALGPRGFPEAVSLLCVRFQRRAEGLKGDQAGLCRGGRPARPGFDALVVETVETARPDAFESR